MEIILLTDIANLGHKDDIVDVKQGYGRNYLIPQGYAILATPSARKVVAENLRQRAHKEAKLKAEAEAIAAQLAEVKLTIGAKTRPEEDYAERCKRDWNLYRSYQTSQRSES